MSFTEDISRIIEANLNGMLSIPSHWQRINLSQIASVQNGCAFDSKCFSREKGRPLIRIRDIVRGYTDTRYNGDFSEEFLVHNGDLLVGMDGDFNSAFWAGDDGLLNQRVCRIRVNEYCYNKKFLGYVLPGYLSAINDYTSSITVKHLSSNTLRNIPLPLPSLAEQSRIAERLDELLTGLTTGMVTLEKVKRKLARYRAAVLHAAVTGRLTEGWRKKHGPAEESGAKLLERILVERRRQWEQRTLLQYGRKSKIPPRKWRERYTESTVPIMSENEIALQVLPEGWCWTIHDQVGHVQLGRQRAPQHHNGNYMRPYLRVANVYEDRIDISDILKMNFTPEEYETYHLQQNDILLNEGQSLELIGRPAMYRGELPGGCFQNTLIRQRVFDGVLPEYAYMVCRAQYHMGRFRQIASITTSIAHLGAQRFAALEFPLPPEQEQAIIVAIVQEKLSQIESLEQRIEECGVKSTYLRQAILQAAFDGKLVPNCIDTKHENEVLK